MTNLSKPATRQKPDYLKGLALAIWTIAITVLAYVVAVALVMFFYACSGHGGEAQGGARWYWSAVFIGAGWTTAGAVVAAIIGLSLVWATDYLEEH